MATSAEVAQARETLSALSEHAQAAMRQMLSDVPAPEAIARMTADQITDLYKLIRDRWWMVAEQFGTMSAALGQAQAALMLESIGRRTPALRPTQGVRDEKAASAALTFALGQDDWVGALLAQMDAHVMGASAESIIDVAEDAQTEVLWQPTGLSTCTYCLRRASYGSYRDFRSEAQREGFMTRPHAGCDCVPILVASDEDWPDDYHPTEYFREIGRRDRERWDRQAARRDAGHKTPGPKTRQSKRRDQSAQAWAERQRITAERDAAKKRIARAGDDQEKIAAAQEVLDRTAAERARLNGTAE